MLYISLNIFKLKKITKLKDKIIIQKYYDIFIKICMIEKEEGRTKK
jgi:hypothetical protein